MAKRGVPKAIGKPEDLLQYFEDYRKWVKANPFVVEDWVGGVGKKVVRKKEKPLTMEGFENYVFRTTKTIATLDHYFSNREGRYSDFVAVCSFIRREIREDQIGGGMAGIFNPSITQRLNNLKEQSETTTVVHSVTLGG
jgi:hypothetical protein